MDASAYREEIYDVFSGSGEEVEPRVERALEVGTAYLDLPIGFLTRIEDGTQEIVAATGDHDLIRPGERCPLDEAYCRRTLEADGALAVQNVAESSAVADRAVRTFGLGTYLGATVTVDGDPFGTVCFAAEATRETPFGEAEEVFLELLAKLIGGALERRVHERELKRRNERLEREKARFEGIAETSFDVLFRVGRDATFTYVSAAAERVLGHDPEDLVGTPFASWLDGAAVDDAIRAFDRTMDGETVENLELDFRDADGDRVVVAVNATPIEEDGRVVGVQGVGRDVTARKERERELHRKTRAMDEAQVGISIADARDGDLPLVYANEGFERVTGYDTADLLGRNCRFLQGEATDPETIDLLGERIAAEEPASVELINYRADGTPFWNQVRLSPVEDDAGTVSHYLGFQTDVTERKRTEQLVRLLNRVLRHNLRNDMNVIRGTGRFLQNGRPDDPTALGERIERTADGLVGLSEQARELERNARREREPTRIDPAALFETTVEDLPADAAVETRVDTDRDLCAGPELERALAELAGNGIGHNPAAEPWLELAATDDGEWVTVTVTDDGPGIDDMETAVIAEGQETELVHGSGLGLWLVNWIVTRYGGSFQIEARGDAEGSVATIRLPGIGADEAVEAVERGPTVLFR
ncbi:PAS domain S-box protein [Haloplanus halophilus]|uniref:PAS domain S-box protein n=1 Tax=Haloplanus halophilus TaxID=2949993 RepID=UPI00203AB6C2|nr:PAS domain S-box protein [Haloplanus sp. GDY1]